MKELGFIVFISYIIGVCGFAVWYNYLFAIEHGFLPWLFFGEFYATFKAMFWPVVELLN